MKTIFQIVFKNWKTTLAALSALFVFSLTVGIGGAYLVGWKLARPSATRAYPIELPCRQQAVPSRRSSRSDSPRLPILP